MVSDLSLYKGTGVPSILPTVEPRTGGANPHYR
jgi:hypothetical protein